ncbi:WD40 domain protein [Hirsutella rhossiliensis]|uniref:WD40 domain protein n=1 Tax=Hirsutella rhossiliensis TaxID=111463 RepID=A0A9P8SJJ4_9HYPO|nr:WD40 domain protein [Hirsutella rhossiliensis]KAH0963096.1 WD40 domain protein [Hirsutella rhossiliensis]
MHASRVFTSSSHCKPSPDGRYVATVRSSTLSVRSVETLQLVNVVQLAQAISGPICSLLWAPSSSKVLVSTAHHIHVVSATDASLHASIRSPNSVGGKPAAIYFGARDTEILTSSSFGLKFSVLDLSTSKVVDISNPKFHHPSTASRGFCLRSNTGHLALLTRAGGKDLVSIHHPTTRQVQRSWSPDMIDAQGLIWTPDGHWLLMWESPAHGHRLLLYTPDGQHLRTVGPPGLPIGQGPQSERALELGIKACQLSPNAEFCAVGDHSRGVMVFSTQSWRESMKLIHPTTIVPRSNVQVWQEQLATAGAKRSRQPFLWATLNVSPPGPSSDAKGAAPVSPGCSLAGFDASSTLLATRLDDSPSTLWIWDLAAAELRAVLIFHSHVTFKWHPTSREVLLVNSQDEARRGASFVWDPLSNGPTSVSPEDYLPIVKAGVRPQVAWINRPFEFPRLLLADAEHYVLLSLSGTEEGPNPWHSDDWDGASAIQDRSAMLDMDDTSALDDTFSFKNA